MRCDLAGFRRGFVGILLVVITVPIIITFTIIVPIAVDARSSCRRTCRRKTRASSLEDFSERLQVILLIFSYVLLRKRSGQRNKIREVAVALLRSLENGVDQVVWAVRDYKIEDGVGSLAQLHIATIKDGIEDSGEGSGVLVVTFRVT